MDTPTKTTNIPAASALDEVLGNVTIDGIERTRRQTMGSLAAQLAGTGAIADAISGAAEGYVVAATWPALAATPGSRAGQPGRTSSTATGSHTDPVTGLTVPNSGEFAWSVSPAGWRWIGNVIDAGALNDAIALKADEADLSAEIEDRSELVARKGKNLHTFSDPYGFSKVVIEEDGGIRWRDAIVVDDHRWPLVIKDQYGFVGAYVDETGSVINRETFAPSILPALADDAKALLPALLVRMQGWPAKLHLKQTMPVRKDVDWFTGSLFVSGNNDGSAPAKDEQTRDVLDFSEFAGSAMLSIRRDGVSNIRHERSLSIVQAPSAAPGGAAPIVAMGIGDSISNRETYTLVDLKLANRGYSTSWCGTMSGAGIGQPPTAIGGVLGEAREGWETGDFTYDVTDRVSIVAPGGEATYTALSKSDKTNINPFLRAATGGDSSSIARNGMVFDFANYLSRFSLATPNIVCIGTGTNDIRDRQGDQLLEFYERGLTIMATQIRAAAPNAYIVFWMPPPARKLDRDDLWSEYAALIRIQMKVKAALADAKIIVCPVWALASSEIDWNDNTSVVDPDTGVDTRGLSDGIHPGSTVRHQMAEALAATIAAISAGLI